MNPFPALSMHLMSKQLIVLFLSLSMCCGNCRPPHMRSTAHRISSKERITSEIDVGNLDPISFYWKMAGLVLPFGYPLEEHFATTTDGYILRVYRIPHGRNQTTKSRKYNDSKKPTVLFLHALLDSSAGFVVNGPNHSLPFRLADAGYDVWLGNMRGNTFSRNHTSLTVADKEFWEFSWDEHASLDAPCILEYVLNVTEVQNVSLVAFSQGTTVTLAALSTLPKFQERVNFAALMGPAAVMHHMSSQPLAAMAVLDTDVLFQILGIREFLPSEPLFAFLEGTACHVVPWLCLNIFTLICGYNPDNLNLDKLPKFLEYTPAGTSVQNMVHWAQAARDVRKEPRLRMFDYGTDCWNFPRSLTGKCNQHEYGSLEPPRYPLEDITTPLALFIGGQDRLADPIDVQLLKSLLRPEVVVYEQVEEKYEHLDFLWGTNADERVYSVIEKLLDEHHFGVKKHSKQPPRFK